MFTKLVTALLLSLAAAQSSAPPPVEALDGMDPVLLVGGKEVMGKPEFKVVRGRFEYWFAAPESKAEFEKEPERYEIQLGGICARMGGAVQGNVSDFAVVDGHIYIFGSDECHKLFVANPTKYMKPPAVAMPASSDIISRGRELLERAVSAMGGAATLDGLTTMAETGTHTEPRRTGNVTIVTRTLRRFPDAIRTERDLPTPRGQITLTTLLLPAGGFALGPNRVVPMIPAAVDYLRADLGRHPFALLRQRRASGAVVAALGRATVEGVEVDQVRMRTGGIDVTLGLNRASGLIHSASFIDRALEGQYGQVVVVYEDYRDVSGLKLPFKRRALFDGAPEPSRSWNASSITINSAVDPRLFEPTASASK